MNIPVPSLVDAVVVHHRTAPIRYRFSMRHTTWLVDVDAPATQQRRALGTFDAADHFDGTATRLRHAIVGWLEAQGQCVDAKDQVLLLTQPRVFGYTFNPISVWWVITPQHRVRHLVAEVHNTYGGRHAYLLDPGWDQETVLAKDFHVSPFNEPSGQYRIRVRLDPTRVSVAVRLHGSDDAAAVASVTGSLKAPTVRRVWWHTVVLFRQPITVRAAITWHGVRLWARRLPVRPRPADDPYRGVRTEGSKGPTHSPGPPGPSQTGPRR